MSPDRPIQTSNEPLIGPCQKCSKVGPLQWWRGEMSELEVARNPGDMMLWCERCCIEAQIEHVKQQAGRLPGLMQALRKLDGEDVMCTCSYEESEEMTRHAPLCAIVKAGLGW